MKEEIHKKLEYLSKYVNQLRNFEDVGVAYFQDHPMELAAIERFFQLAIEVVLDICSMIISYEGLNKPDEYKKSILELGVKGILNKEFANRFSNMAGFRNILVHNYAEIEVEKVHYNLTNNLKDFDDFAKQIANYLKELAI